MASASPHQLRARRASNCSDQGDQCEVEQTPQERSETAEGFRGWLRRCEHSTRRERSAGRGRSSGKAGAGEKDVNEAVGVARY